MKLEVKHPSGVKEVEFEPTAIIQDVVKSCFPSETSSCFFLCKKSLLTPNSTIKSIATICNNGKAKGKLVLKVVPLKVKVHLGKVQGQQSSEPIEISIRRSHTLKHIMESINESHSIPIHSQNILFNGHYVDQEFWLADEILRTEKPIDLQLTTKTETSCFFCGRKKDETNEIKELVQEARSILGQGGKRALEAHLDASSGVYFVRFGSTPYAAFKPSDEERGMPNCRSDDTSFGDFTIPPGTGSFREVAAYLLDREGFAGVPPTALVAVANRSLNYPKAKNYSTQFKVIPKIGALQRYIENTGIDPYDDYAVRNVLPVDEVHKIALLDLRILNNDRNSGNMLVIEDESGFDNNDEDCAAKESVDYFAFATNSPSARTSKKYTLKPIDHGYGFPEDAVLDTFGICWYGWPQVKKPFSEKTLEYLERLDPDADAKILKNMQYSDRLEIFSEKAIQNIRLLGRFVKMCAAAGVTLHDMSVLLTTTNIDWKERKKTGFERLLEETENYLGARMQTSRRLKSGSRLVTNYETIASMSEHETDKETSSAQPSPLIAPTTQKGDDQPLRPTVLNLGFAPFVNETRFNAMRNSVSPPPGPVTTSNFNSSSLTAQKLHEEFANSKVIESLSTAPSPLISRNNMNMNPTINTHVTEINLPKMEGSPKFMKKSPGLPLLSLPSQDSMNSQIGYEDFDDETSYNSGMFTCTSQGSRSGRGFEFLDVSESHYNSSDEDDEFSDCEDDDYDLGNNFDSGGTSISTLNDDRNEGFHPSDKSPKILSASYPCTPKDPPEIPLNSQNPSNIINDNDSVSSTASMPSAPPQFARVLTCPTSLSTLRRTRKSNIELGDPNNTIATQENLRLTEKFLAAFEQILAEYLVRHYPDNDKKKLLRAAKPKITPAPSPVITATSRKTSTETTSTSSNVTSPEINDDMNRKKADIADSPFNNRGIINNIVAMKNDDTKNTATSMSNSSSIMENIATSKILSLKPNPRAFVPHLLSQFGGGRQSDNTQKNMNLFSQTQSWNTSETNATIDSNDNHRNIPNNNTSSRNINHNNNNNNNNTPNKVISRPILRKRMQSRGRTLTELTQELALKNSNAVTTDKLSSFSSSKASDLTSSSFSTSGNTQPIVPPVEAL
eukprot:TRINITY_DN47946_c3_g1_i1.p1 TRINITY_DN47946_c3_g1~~TRINITY_DN47946_c3_g1_i1.p1  ORF type:complete len:1127 (-),score=309.76 TRINITY_DN47946_c3_g1_i1:224-3604(-)